MSDFGCLLEQLKPNAEEKAWIAVRDGLQLTYASATRTHDIAHNNARNFTYKSVRNIRISMFFTDFHRFSLILTMVMMVMMDICMGELSS